MDRKIWALLLATVAVTACGEVPDKNPHKKKAPLFRDGPMMDAPRVTLYKTDKGEVYVQSSTDSDYMGGSIGFTFD